MLEAFVFDGAGAEEFELGEEHGWHAVECCASVLLDGVEGRERVEALAWEDDGAAMCGGGHVAEDAAEAAGES